MREIDRVRQALKKLEETVNKAKLPSDKNVLVDCFAPIFKQLFLQYKRHVVDPTQQIHFAAIYGLVRIHCAQIKEKLEWTQSNVGYVRSFVETNESQDYHKVLLDFLNEFEDDFQNYRRSIDAKKYIVAQKAPAYYYLVPNNHLKFSFGREMADVKEGALKSIAQLQKRIFAITYFDMFEKEVDRVMLRNTGSAVVTNAAVATLAFPALLVTVPGTLYFGWKESEIKTSLEGNDLTDDLSVWDDEIKKILSNPAKSKDTLKRLGIQPESVHRNDAAPLYLSS